MGDDGTVVLLQKLEEDPVLLKLQKFWIGYVVRVRYTKKKRDRYSLKILGNDLNSYLHFSQNFEKYLQSFKKCLRQTLVFV